MKWFGKKMWVVLGVLVASQFAFADAKHNHAPIARGPASSGARYLMYLGAGMIVGGGSALPGIGVSILTRLTQNLPLYVGGDSGMFFRTGPFADIIPILPTLVYKIPTTPDVTPYVGIDLGPVFTLGNNGGIDAAMFFKPGVEFNTRPDFDIFFEARFGVIESSFAFFPHLGAILRI